MSNLEDIVDDFLLDEGLQALESSEQCWGAALARSCGTQGAIKCTFGFVRGRNHLKNKICDVCRRHGIFVRVDRVWVLADSVHCDFSNKHGAGLWTSMPTHPSVGFRLINQSSKCKGPRMLVCNRELPAALASSCTPLDDRFVIHGRWVHLHLRNGTLVPSPSEEIVHGPARHEPWWAAALPWGEGDCSGERDDRVTKRARLPESVDASTASPSSPTLSGCPQGSVGDAEIGTLLETTGAVSTPLDMTRPGVLEAHVQFAACLAASLGGQPGLSLSRDEHMALAALLHHVRASETLLRDGGSGGGGIGEAATLGRTESPLAHPLAQAQEAFPDVDGLLSWPPSPPGTAAGGERLQESAGCGRLSSTACHLHARPTVGACTRTTPSRAAVLYFHLLVLCASALAGQAFMALLTSLFPGLLCHSVRHDDSSTIATYGIVVSIMLAGSFVLAEAVGLIPMGCVCAGHGTHTPPPHAVTL